MNYFENRKSGGSGTSGFTLIELMISTAVLSILMMIIAQAYISNDQATQILNSKIKMRDEARIGMTHMVRNLRMADMFDMEYIDGNDNNQFWPPADSSVFVRGITFRRPVDLDGDGDPFGGNTLAVDWSGRVTYRIDTNDVNGDGNTLQVVQLLNNAFVKVLINDVAPAGQDLDNNGTLYDTPTVGGFWLTATDDADAGLVHLHLVQQRTLTNGSSIFTYYEDFVRPKNNTDPDQ